MAAKKKNEVLSKEVLTQLEKAFSLGCPDMEACNYAKITEDQLKAYIKENPTFGAKREVWKQRPSLIARQTVINAIKEDPKIALEYLDRISGMK